MIIPPQVTHEQPVTDSRGLVFAPDHEAWNRSGSTLALAGGYVPEDAPHAETAPCDTCGEPAPVVTYTYATETRYGACPVLEAEACVIRGLEKKRAEEAAQAIEAAPAQKALPAPPKTASSIRKRRSRPSQARKTVLGQAPAKADGDG